MNELSRCLDVGIETVDVVEHHRSDSCKEDEVDGAPLRPFLSKLFHLVDQLLESCYAPEGQLLVVVGCRSLRRVSWVGRMGRVGGVDPRRHPRHDGRGRREVLPSAPERGGVVSLLSPPPPSPFLLLVVRVPSSSSSSSPPPLDPSPFPPSPSCNPSHSSSEVVLVHDLCLSPRVS